MVCHCHQCKSVDHPMDMVIDRLPEIPFNLYEVDKCKVKGINGRDVFFRDIRKDHTSIVIFCRNFIEQDTNDYIGDFAQVSPSYLRDNRVKIILIASADHANLASFCDETKFVHEVYTDPDLVIHNKARLFPQIVDTGFKKRRNPHLKHNSFIRFLLSVQRASVMSTKGQGSIFQQGGQVVIDADGKVLYFHRDRHNTDQTSINFLLASSGLSKSFDHFKSHKTKSNLFPDVRRRKNNILELI